MIRWWVESTRGVIGENYRWMSWNLLLAALPLVLSRVLFSGPATPAPPPARRIFWWSGVVLFVLFLPNAPYVTTDLIHFFATIRRGATDGEIAAAIAPVYALFIVAGLMAYERSLTALRRFVAASGRPRSGLPIELILHLLSAVGVYLGRITRVNSWHVVTAPTELVGHVHSLAHPFAVAAVVSLTVVFVCATFAIRAIENSAAEYWRALRHAVRSA